MINRTFPPGGLASAATPRRPAEAFREFDAAELYCPRCRRAGPVRKSLFLVLPQGDKYLYRCAQCGETVGTKIDRKQNPSGLIR